MSISEKQLAANRANVAKSTGPRSPQGKARSAQNARKQDPEAVAELIRNAIAVYQPLNSQEQDAVERIALSQHSIQRLFRMEAVLFTSLFDNGLTTRHGMCEELAPEGINRTQNQNYFMAEGHRRLDPKFYAAFVRHQAQAERFFRRAELAHDLVENPADDLPNEPISTPQPAQTEPLPSPPNEPSTEPAASPTPDPSLPPEKETRSPATARAILSPDSCLLTPPLDL